MSITVLRQRYQGFVDVIAFSDVAVCISGRIRDRVASDAIIVIEAVLDGIVLGSTTVVAAAIDKVTLWPFVLSAQCGGSDFAERGITRERSTGQVLGARDVNKIHSADPFASTCMRLSASPQDIVGAVTGFADPRSLCGWAVDPAMPLRPISLSLFINGSLYSRTRTKPIGRELGRFRFELNGDLLASGPQQYQVTTDSDNSELRGSVGTIAGRLSGKFDRDSFSSASRRSISTIELDSPSVSRSTAAAVAIIVVNYNGADRLLDLLKSLRKHNTHHNTEIIVVDHGSSDGSREAAEGVGGDFKIIWMDRGGNFGFADSCNFGAEATKAEVLIFANNDLVVLDDALPKIQRILQNEQVGAVGIKLLDPPSGESDVVQHLGVHFDAAQDWLMPRPFETRPASHLVGIECGTWEVPAVCGAFIACRADVFRAAGGFDVDYYYGFEDIDFCLRLRFVFGKIILCCNELRAIHVGGWSRDKSPPSRHSQNRNELIFLRRWGGAITRELRRLAFTRPAFLTSHTPVIAFAVTEVKDDTKFGDYYSALELGSALTGLTPCQVVFLPIPDWYDLTGVDVLIAMRSDYDLRRAKGQNHGFTAIAWARNWIREWCSSPSIDCFHMLWAASELAAVEMRRSLSRHVDVLRLAANFGRFSEGRPEPAWSADFCFTGSYHGHARDLATFWSQLPKSLTGKVFGHGWDSAPVKPAGSMGAVPYAALADVYASTKVVVDDTHPGAQEWGCVNSRVFDALAAGCLPISNCVAGIGEVFGSKLPTYQTAGELSRLLERFATDKPLRQRVVKRLRAEVGAKHTYHRRAEEAIKYIARNVRESARFAIKVAAPNEGDRESWGDYHLAKGVARALGRRGYGARIDTVENWYSPLAASDDCVLVLRGLSQYEPRPGQVNVAWMISHPEAVSLDELRRYEHVFVASDPYCRRLQKEALSVSRLLQCTDPELFNSGTPDRGWPAYDVLFVGNSREQLRMGVRLAIQNCPRNLAIIGSGWEGFVPPYLIKGTQLANSLLSTVYRKAGIVLVDHWPDMRREGFISNRIFDALAAGGRPVSDRVDGIQQLFDGFVSLYDDDPVSFQAAIDDASSTRGDERRRKAVERLVAAEHSFDARVDEILRVIVPRTRCAI